MKINKKKIFPSKKRIYLKYVKFETFRQKGAYWVNIFFQYISWQTIKDSFIIGGIAKLTIFQDFPIIPFIIVVVILGFLAEGVKAYIVYLDFKYGVWRVHAEWAQKNKVISPWNVEVRGTLEEICKKVGAKSKFKDV